MSSVTALLDSTEIEKRLEELGNEWSGDSKHLVGTYKFPTFLDGIEFVRQVAVAAEEINHHPDIDIRWTSVTLDIATHSEGGVTGLDFALAESADEIATMLTRGG
jgi:4a-hydroxytetrahydrobiopterin dehydratase